MMPVAGAARQQEVGRYRPAAQLPASACTSGKNSSFQLAALTLIVPIACMNSPYFMVFSGTIVHFTCAPDATLRPEREGPGARGQTLVLRPRQ